MLHCDHGLLLKFFLWTLDNYETDSPNSSKIELFSILIPSWNNLEMLRPYVESVKIISAFSHQIIVHVNDGSDGTLEWVRSQKMAYTYSEKNVRIPEFRRKLSFSTIKAWFA